MSDQKAERRTQNSSRLQRSELNSEPTHPSAELLDPLTVVGEGPGGARLPYAHLPLGVAALVVHVPPVHRAVPLLLRQCASQGIADVCANPAMRPG